MISWVLVLLVALLFAVWWFAVCYSLFVLCWFYCFGLRLFVACLMLFNIVAILFSFILYTFLGFEVWVYFVILWVDFVICWLGVMLRCVFMVCLVVCLVQGIWLFDCCVAWFALMIGVVALLNCVGCGRLLLCCFACCLLLLYCLVVALVSVFVDFR